MKYHLFKFTPGNIFYSQEIINEFKEGLWPLLSERLTDHLCGDPGNAATQIQKDEHWDAMKNNTGHIKSYWSDALNRTLVISTLPARRTEIYYEDES